MKMILTFLSVLFTLSLSAQNSWIPIENFPAGGRVRAAGFSIDNKLYVGTGGTNYDYHNDFWEYDPETQVWTQKADVGGALRSGCVGFSLNGKGYIGLGSTPSNQYNDMWEYDPGTNVWSFHSMYPGNNVTEAVAFTIGDVAYVASGSPNSSIGNETNIMWAYDFNTGSWDRKEDFPGVPRDRAVGFAINDKGYLGVGFSQNTSVSPKDFYEYDPALDSWTRIADYPGAGSSDCVGFALQNHGYVGMGYQRNTDMWRYNPINDTWTEVDSFWGSGRLASLSLATNEAGYVGLGYIVNSQGVVEFTDFFRFEDQTLSLENTSMNLISVYPNPVSSDLFVEGMPSSSYSYEIWDIRGKKIISDTHVSSSIDVSELPAGFYFLKLLSDNIIFTKKFIKK